jgi:rSAM/selenodomain-associated transferase 1
VPAARLAAQLVVIAKAPVPGRVKTRLTPPFSPRQAAWLAEAALVDTLAAAALVPAAGHTVALEGRPGRWLPASYAVLRQRGRGLDERIAAAMGDVHARQSVPVVLIGMDTPQVTPSLLAAAIRPLTDGTAGAVYGPAPDGGFWLLGLRTPDPGLVTGVPMSASDTGQRLLARLAAAGLRVHHLPPLTDVDTAADVLAVARQVPGSRFAATTAAILAAARPGTELSLLRADREWAVPALSE